MQKNNNNTCTVSVLNLVSYIKGGIQAKGIREQDPKGNIWVQT